MADIMNALMQGFNTAREMKREDGLRNALSGYMSNPDAPNALGQIAMYDPRTAMAVREDQSQRAAQAEKQRNELLAQGKKAVGQAALMISQLPPEQQAQAWDSQIDYLVDQGYDGLAPYKGKYSPQSLQGVLAEAGLAGEYQKAQEPDLRVIPAGGRLYDVRGASTVATGSMPQAGAVEEGYRFKGGDPADPSAWEPVSAGGAGSGQPGFR